MTQADPLDIRTPALQISCSLVPWDTAAFGFPVAQITKLEVRDHRKASQEYKKVRDWLDNLNIRILSCRLPHDCLRESMFLEAQGHRFIEMVLHPCLSNLHLRKLPIDTLNITPAKEAELHVLSAIAERAFHFERFHSDPRLDPHMGNVRYARWVRNSLDHPTQRLLKIEDGNNIVAFFLVEMSSSLEAYWHLTAVAPEWQGRGYGKRVWRSMLRHHRKVFAR